MGSNDYRGLLSQVDGEGYGPKAESAIQVTRKKIKRHDYFVDDVDAIAKVRPWQQAWSRSVKQAYGYQCAMRPLAETAFLVGSHIIPVKDSEHKQDRANPSNGLCLCVLHDKAFDKGYITIDDTFRIFSSILDKQSHLCKALSLETNDKMRLPNGYAPENDFLDYHRKKVFLG